MTLPGTSVDDYRYFVCDWYMYPLHKDTLSLVIDTAVELGCSIRPERWKIVDEGFRVHTFLIRVPSLEALDQFVARAGKQMGLTNWYPISTGKDELKGFGEWHREIFAGFMQMARECGLHNQRLRDELNSLTVEEGMSHGKPSAIKLALLRIMGIQWRSNWR